MPWAPEATHNDKPSFINEIRLGIDIASDGGDEMVVARYVLRCE